MDRETGSCAGEGSCSARGGYVGQMLIGCSQCVLTVCWAGHGRRGYGADCAREGSWWAVRGRVLCALRCDATLAWRRGRVGLPRAGRGRHLRWGCGLLAGICEFSTKSHRSVLLYQCRRGRPSAACRKHMVGSSSRAAVQPSSCGSKTRTWPSRIGTTRWTSAALAATRPQSMRRAGVPARRTCPDRLR